MISNYYSLFIKHRYVNAGKEISEQTLCQFKSKIVHSLVIQHQINEQCYWDLPCEMYNTLCIYPFKVLFLLKCCDTTCDDDINIEHAHLAAGISESLFFDVNNELEYLPFVKHGNLFNQDNTSFNDKKLPDIALNVSFMK